MFGLLKRNEGAVDSALPGDVLAAIEGATFHPRAAGTDGAARVVVQMNGFAGWIHGDEADAKQLAKAFPELNSEQLTRACRFLANLVQQHLAMVENGGTTQRRNWVRNW